MNEKQTRLDYTGVAPGYDARYTAGPRGVTGILRALARCPSRSRILEIGCGTGYWLERLHGCGECWGLDFSAGMLHEARSKDASFFLIRGEAGSLPFASRTFDFIYSVHAVHHFPSPRAFIRESHRLLRPGGALAVIGMDPHLGEDHWYVYDYFDGTLARDHERYPSSEDLVRHMVETGFVRCDRRSTARLDYDFIGREVFTDPILHPGGTSQLALLSEEAFGRGMRRIREAVVLADRQGRPIVFPAHIALPAIIGFVAASP